MALVPRNDPCPCGSGKKYKRCCIDRERELLRKADVVEELFGLASMFPLLRPDCPELDAFVDAHEASEPTRESIERAGSLLPAEERRRIARTHANEFPEVWRSLVADLGDEGEAETLVVGGAIVAVLCEARGVEPTALELIESREDVRADSVEVLACALDPTDLWSVAEATSTEEALAEIPEALDDDAYEVAWWATIDAQAARHWSPRHERRLVRLVERLRTRVSPAANAEAKAAVADACVAFERDRGLHLRLAALLLADSVGRLRQLEILAAVAA